MINTEMSIIALLYICIFGFLNYKAMRKHTFLFIIFLYVGICIQVKATDQRGEYLVIGKDTLEMLT